MLANSFEAFASFSDLSPKLANFSPRSCSCSLVSSMVAMVLPMEPEVFPVSEDDVAEDCAPSKSSVLLLS